MTSVKDLHVDRAATADRLGRGRFSFTDDYSVFDWGKMPDEIPGKGASLCTMSAFNFERLEARGIPTHYRGVVADGETTDLDGLDADADAPAEMAVDLATVPELPHDGRDYDYDDYYAAARDNVLVPLEIVFRNSVPVGSSIRSRATPGECGLDADSWPDEPVSLPNPVVEFSTKLEEGDRYLDREEAERIAGPADLNELESVALDVNDLVTQRAESVGLTHQDGKIECVLADGEVRVADAVGTFDENRFSYDGQQVSKEVVRQYYKRTQPDWVEAVSAAKARADEEDVADWKGFCDRTPDPLPESVVRATSDLYRAGANAYTGVDFFDAPALDAAVDAVRDL
ncbi:phosphoribosylaminoimidazolesuccinocarboxamide synthase [Salarchaeum japonicum]|uniref:phosphoribosylaminoimidazolesuccinocarboxamide synthase n=1 Tax=Salarchaeum japonicum TaxID=555573 RepID=UPI003C71AD2A